MMPSLRTLVLSCMACLPVQVLAQDAPPPMPPTMPAPPMMPPAMQPTIRDLGMILDGQEAMFTVTRTLDLQNASQEQVNAAIDGTIFSVSDASGFCLSAVAPGAPTVVLFNGVDRVTGQVLFDADTGLAGLSTEEGRRSFVQTQGPINETSFLLSTLVGQAMGAPGDTVTVIIRAFPDSTAVATLDTLCGPFKVIAAPPMPPMMPMPTPMPAPVAPVPPVMMN
jgi:hypothetical protein